MPRENKELDHILTKFFTSEFRKGYIHCRGFTMAEHYNSLKEDISNLNVPNDDVWVCSFPKTGTNKFEIFCLILLSFVFCFKVQHGHKKWFG